MKKRFLAGLAIVVLIFGIVDVAKATSISFIAVDTVSTTPNNRVWRDDRLRAYDNRTSTDAYGFMLFDISTLDDDAIITNMTLTTYHEYGFGNPYGNPIVEILYSSNDNWSRNTVSGFIGGLGEVLSTNNTSFPTGDNIPYSWSINVSAHDWSVDLLDNFICLAMNQTNPGYNYVYWHGSDNPSYAPKLTIEYTTSPVPEPSTIFLFGIGLLSLAGTGIKRKDK